MVRIPYKKFRYIYPPRPENALPKSQLANYDNEEYGAQPKLNGDCSVLFTNGIETHIWKRHGEKFKKKLKLEPTLHKLHRETLSDKAGDPQNKWMVLVGEYMLKSKKDHHDEIWNDKFVIFDILVYDGIQLVGTTFKERVELLDSLYGKDDTLLTSEGVEQLKFLYTTSVEDVFRVKTFYNCFKALWKDLVKIDMMEGLVLKRMDAILENGVTELNNSNWQVKFRKSTKNYQY